MMGEDDAARSGRGRRRRGRRRNTYYLLGDFHHAFLARFFLSFLNSATQRAKDKERSYEMVEDRLGILVEKVAANHSLHRPVPGAVGAAAP